MGCSLFILTLNLNLTDMEETKCSYIVFDNDNGDQSSIFKIDHLHYYSDGRVFLFFESIDGDLGIYFDGQFMYGGVLYTGFSVCAEHWVFGNDLPVAIDPSLIG